MPRIEALGYRVELRDHRTGSSAERLEQVHGTHVEKVLSLDAQTLVVFVRAEPFAPAEQAELRDYAYAGWP